MGQLRVDHRRMCVICTSRSEEEETMWQIFKPRPTGNGFAVCSDCWKVLHDHGLCEGSSREILDADSQKVQRCLACAIALDRPRGSILEDIFGGTRPYYRQLQAEHRHADHRLRPCRCPICRKCAERVGSQSHFCPLCETRVTNISDERALLETGWLSARP